jgi:hypothetical protein
MKPRIPAGLRGLTPRQLAAWCVATGTWLSGPAPARAAVQRAGQADTGWQAAEPAATRQPEADPFSPEDRAYLADEAQRLGVTPELVVQRLGEAEDPDGLWRDREAG